MLAERIIPPIFFKGAYSFFSSPDPFAPRKGQPRYDETFVCDVMKQTLRADVSECQKHFFGCSEVRAKALAFMHSHKFMHKERGH